MEEESERGRDGWREGRKTKKYSFIYFSSSSIGKTVAGELAIYFALALDFRVYYTTPFKALSHQKCV